MSVCWVCDGGRVVAGGGQTAASRWTLLLADCLELSTGNFTIIGEGPHPGFWDITLTTATESYTLQV